MGRFFLYIPVLIHISTYLFVDKLPQTWTGRENRVVFLQTQFFTPLYG